MRVPFLLSLVAALAAQLLPAAAKIKGMAFSTGHDLYGYRQPYTDESLTQLKGTGTNYVHITAYARMSGLYAPFARRVTDDASIRFIIRKCKSRGFSVFFKPVIEIDNVWRGFLKGWPSWFNNIYLPYIMQMAHIAQQERVNLFAVGSEYRDTLNKTEDWIRVINNVKTVYKGKITYVANHDAYKKVEFWHHLDYVALSAYFELVSDGKSYGHSPDMGQTRYLWNVLADTVEQWRSNNGINKQIIIAEFGVQSKGNGVVYRRPWDWLIKAPVNFWEQVKMYQGFLAAFMPRSWCEGVVIWNWELRPTAGLYLPSKAWYTPQNKPALNILKEYFQQY